MNVGELLDYLSTRPREQPVILMNDTDADDYSPLADAEEGLYAATSTWAGDVYYPGDDDPDDDQPENAVPVVVLRPMMEPQEEPYTGTDPWEQG